MGPEAGLEGHFPPRRCPESSQLPKREEFRNFEAVNIWIQVRYFVVGSESPLVCSRFFMTQIRTAVQTAILIFSGLKLKF